MLVGCYLTPPRLVILTEKFRHHIPMNVRKPVVAALETKRQSFVIKSQEMHNRGLQIVDMHFVLHNFEP